MTDSKAVAFVRPVKFPLGKIFVTTAAVEALIRNDFELIHLLKRHREGDYGEMPYDDRKRSPCAPLRGHQVSVQVNEKSIKQGIQSRGAMCGRVLSSYPLPDGTVIWIITVAGWTETTCLVREEY